MAARLGTGGVDLELHVEDGARVARGDHLATIAGSTRTTLVAERTALNVLSRTSGVATHTRRWADELEGSGAMVLDTRKTTPACGRWRSTPCAAAAGRTSGWASTTARWSRTTTSSPPGSLTAAIAAIREQFPDVPVQVEVTTTEEALEAVGAGARFLLCDNMSTDLLRSTVAAVRDTGETVEVEATGGLTLEVAAAYAATGVDYLSVGGLTHSSPIVDIALDLDPARRLSGPRGPGGARMVPWTST